MFAWFERRIEPYPSREAQRPPSRLIAFCWHYSRDAVPWLLLMAFLTAVIAIGEVYLFGFLGDIVNWLSDADREGFLAREGLKLALMAAIVLVGLPAVVLLQSLVVHQTLLGNYPMIARWQMHRYLLRQSLSFFADEFAGRVATRVMQTSLAVRESVMKMLDVFVYISVYFLTAMVLVSTADWRLTLPFLLWGIVYGIMIRFFVPKLKELSRQQADSRSMMTGRVVDSYTNIATVKLFSHAHREEGYARFAMDEFLRAVHRQMRLVTLFHSIVYFNNGVLIFLIGSLSIGLWLGEAISVGSIAIAIGLSLRLNNMSQWIMWEVSAFFENIGVVMDGMSMMSQPHVVTDPLPKKTLVPTQGAIEFEGIRFHYGKEGGVIENLSLSIEPGEKIGLVGPLGCGQDDNHQPAAAVP